MNANLFAFAVLATLTILSALGVVFFPNAVRSALSLVASFFLLAVLYFTLNSEMLGITQIVVYAGAIMVLFLFVIMLLNLSSGKQLMDQPDPKRLVAGLLGLGLVAVVGAEVFAPLLSTTQIFSPSSYGSPEAIGTLLFTQFAYPFEAVSVLLLIGIVGSILLAKRRVQ